MAVLYPRLGPWVAQEENLADQDICYSCFLTINASGLSPQDFPTAMDWVSELGTIMNPSSLKSHWPGILSQKQEEKHIQYSATVKHTVDSITPAIKGKLI